MAPPAKRRRRNVLPSSPTSISEDEVTAPNPKGQLVDLISSSPPQFQSAKVSMSANGPTESQTALTKNAPRPKSINILQDVAPSRRPLPTRGGKSNLKSNTSSPEKSKSRLKVEEKGKSGNILTLFSQQTQRQQAQSVNPSTRPRPKALLFDDVDLISDDEVFESIARTGSVVGQAARKRAKVTEPLQDDGGSIPSASQRFVTRAKPSLAPVNEDDLRPWAERFAPANLDELAVHKKKVSDVRRWLEEVMSGRMRQRLLILKGAAGTAKTTTVQLLAKSMDCSVLEWRNPVGSVASADGFQSMSAQFEEFMGRGGKFGQLDLFSTDGNIQAEPKTKPLDRRKNIMLVEEFPNTFTRSSTALQSFRSAVLQYLASNVPALSMMHGNSLTDQITPVVMIISETLLTTTSASADSFTAHRLLGSEILQHPGVGLIEFNSIAPTILAKALELVVQKESRQSGRRKTPGPLVLKKLGEVGDIRSAIGSLEFLCLRGDVDGDWGSKITFGKPKKGSKDVNLTMMETESLELVTRREASLGIFHAVGKVVYNKREETLSENYAEKVTDFMSINRRPRRSQVDVDSLIDETGTDTQTFISALHENYLLSCEAPSTSFDFSSLDHVSGCIDSLSDSDLLCPSWDTSFNASGPGFGTSGDILRQEEISFQIAVRGILFSLPWPVKRVQPAAGGLRTGKGGDEHKMFYPTSLKLWRMKEEIEGTIDMWVTRVMKGDMGQLGGITSNAAAFMKPKNGTIESWKTGRPPQSSLHPQAQTQDSKTNKAWTSSDSSPPLPSVGSSARKEMLLERLPYMVSILRANSRRHPSSSSPLSTAAIREIEKVTMFRGIGASLDDQNEEDEDEDAGLKGEQWATDGNTEGRGGGVGSPRKKKGGGLIVGANVKWKRKGIQGEDGGIVSGGGITGEQKWVLSDDDIEDE